VFYQIVKDSGIDTLLNSPQTFTVWAPTNEAMTGYFKDGMTKEQFLKNHIARFIYNTTDLESLLSFRLQVLNGKYQTFSRESGRYEFGGAFMENDSRIASNGLLHAIDARVPFYYNLWEIIQKSENTDSIARYLTSFDEKEFLPSLSIPIGQNEYGQIVYDSVFYNSNIWQQKFGLLEREDSVYTMILPDNTAWEEAYKRINPYYKTFGNLIRESGTGVNLIRYFETKGSVTDSLQYNHTRRTITQDLVFRKSLDPIPNDSIISTNGNIFRSPEHLFEGATKIPVSNGFAYKTSELRHDPTSSWHLPILIESENSVRTAEYAIQNIRSADETFYKDSISNGSFLELKNTSTSSVTQPYVTFLIRGVLAAKYNIYCVFAPAMAFDEGAAPDSTKVQFYLNYVHTDGSMKEDAAITSDPVTGKNFVTKGTGMTRFLIAKGFEFPYANASDDQIPAVRLRVRTNVAANETMIYQKWMRIDCLILEPVNE
jgi:hypothetical protein